MLADRVDLGDICTAGEQLTGQIGDVVQRNAVQRQLKECAAAAGDQKEDSIICRQAGHKLQSAPCSCDAILVRNRMPSLDDFQMADRAFTVIVFGDHNAA